MPYHPSPLLHDARPASWRTYRDTERALEAVEQLAVRLVQAPIANVWLAGGGSAGDARVELTVVADEVMARQGPIAIADRRAGADTPITRLMERLRWVALLAIPLYDASGAVFAVLVAADVRARAWSEQEVLLLRELATLAALSHPRGRGDVRVWLQRLALEAARDARRNLEAETARSAAADVMRSASRTQATYRELLGQISHELRTPLNAIVGFAGLLQENGQGHLDERELSYVQRVLEGGERLAEQLGDVLDLFRIDAETFAVAPDDVPLTAVIRDVIDALGREHTGLELHVEMADHLARVRTDPAVLRRALRHLVSYALAEVGTRAQIRARCDAAGGALLLEVRAAEGDPAAPHTTGAARLHRSELGATVAAALCRALGHPLTVRLAPGGCTIRLGVEWVAEAPHGCAAAPGA